MRFCTTTLGCKANQYDTGSIEDTLRGRGHEQVKAGEGCDVCIVNTCAVTAGSVRKSRQAVRRARRLEPGAVIAVCGCYPQLDGDAAASLGADIIGGTGDREEFAGKVEEFYIKHHQEQHFAREHNDNSQFSKHREAEIFSNSQLSSAAAHGTSRTRALLKIQDGCDNCCTYCVIPQARGHSRSMALSEVAGKAGALRAQGYKEIVLTGIEISSYRPHLTDAVRIVSENAPDARIRLGSLDPGILTADFISRLKEIPNLCSHFHISLQSGCNSTLARMGRRYSTEQVTDAIGRLRCAFDNCGVTADLIVGFPGETGTEFEQTIDFIEKAAFSAMHIFPYSPRPGTKAADMPGQIPGGVKRERAKTAAAIAAKLSKRFRHAQTGRILEVLFETSRPAGLDKKERCSIGHSSNYLRVAVIGKIDKNTMKNVKISSIKNGMLTGEIV